MTDKQQAKIRREQIAEQLMEQLAPFRSPQKVRDWCRANGFGHAENSILRAWRLRRAIGGAFGNFPPRVF